MRVGKFEKHLASMLLPKKSCKQPLPKRDFMLVQGAKKRLHGEKVYHANTLTLPEKNRNIPMKG